MLKVISGLGPNSGKRSVQQPLIIGTRGSPLALAQATLVRDLLVAAHPGLARPSLAVIKTTGDRIQDRPLAEAGGKGLFTKEIEEALLSGAIDMAVHSMKDVPTVLPDGLVIDCILPREDPRDVLIGAPSLAALAPGARVGTASLRRGAQLRVRRPDLTVAPLRGNVGTRLARIAAGDFAATFLALAGLRRLGLADRASAVLEPEVMLPAIAQGAIGIERRADDRVVAERLAPLDHGPSRLVVETERAFLHRLDGSCRTPIAGLARLDRDRLRFDGEILAPDGRAHFTVTLAGTPAEHRLLGIAAADDLLSRAGADFLAP